MQPNESIDLPSKKFIAPLPEYSACILYFRRGPDVVSTIRDLLNQTHPPVEIIVLDNASNDGVIAKLNGMDPKVRFVYSELNLGYAAGMNFAFQNIQSKTDWTLFLTHEVRMNMDTLKNLLSINLGKPDNPVLQIGPTLVLLEEDTIWSSGGWVTSTGSARHKTELDRDRKVSWLDGACHVVRTGDLSTSIFNESFFLYWEDVELSLRLSERGQVVCVRDALAYQSTNTTPDYFMSRNRIRIWLIRKDFPKLVASLLALYAKVVRDLMRGRFAIARTKHVGIIDGITGKFHSEHFFRGR